MKGDGPIPAGGYHHPSSGANPLSPGPPGQHNGLMPDRRIRIFLADDNLIVRESVRALLALEDDLEVVGVAADYDELVTGAEQAAPEVIVTDIRMPPSFQTEGIDAAKEKIQSAPGSAPGSLDITSNPSSRKTKEPADMAQASPRADFFFTSAPRGKGPDPISLVPLGPGRDMDQLSDSGRGLYRGSASPNRRETRTAGVGLAPLKKGTAVKPRPPRI